MSKKDTYRMTAGELRTIIREAIINEKIGGEKIKGWKPPWASNIEGEGDWATTNRWEGSDTEEMYRGLGGYEREIEGEGYSDHDDDGDDDDGDDD